MLLTRQRDTILIKPQNETDIKTCSYLSNHTRFHFSAGAKAWVVPEWAYMGLPEGFKGPITGDPERKRQPTNHFNLLHLPKVLREALYDFQSREALHLLNGPCGLWLDCGVGKTITTLAGYAMLKAQGKVDGMIVIGPENGRHVWCGPRSESNRWLGQPGYYLESGSKEKPPTNGIIYTTATKVFMSPYFEWLTDLIRTRRFVLCVDEVQQCSGALSKRFDVIRSWRRNVEYSWLLSATPTSNYPDSFWAIYQLLTNSDVKLDAWVSWFQVGKGTGSKSQWHKERLAGLRKYLSYCTTRIRKADVAPWLPPVTEQVQYVPMVGRQRKLYDQLIKEGRADLSDSKIHAGKNWQHKLVFLTSMASHPMISGDTDWKTSDIAKLEALDTIIKSAGKQKICIWSWHPKVLDWLCKMYPNSVRYHGEVSKKEKEDAVYRFNNDPDVQFFFGNPSAAGTSLNLGEGTVRIFWDLGWSYVQYHQACERINRITRTKPITSYVLIGENTVEELMWRAILRKEELANLITTDAKKASTNEREALTLWK